MSVKLSTLAIVMGAVTVAINLYGVLKPAKFAVIARKFPRSLPLGFVLTLLATAWFIWNVRGESLSDFETMKNFLCILFAAVGIGTCIFVHDYLAVRGAAALLLLLAKLIVDTARWSNTDWRVIIVLWAYVMVAAGIWFTVSPWRLRDLIHWTTANDSRTKISSGIRLSFGALVLLLGLTVY